jgi:hypothetical protein
MSDPSDLGLFEVKAVLASQLAEQVVSTYSPLLILAFAMFDELAHVRMFNGVGVVEVSVVDLGTLQSVILDADEVVDDVVGDGVFARHASPLGSTSRYELRR